jgi:hypothetical protein
LATLTPPLGRLSEMALGGDPSGQLPAIFNPPLVSFVGEEVGPLPRGQLLWILASEVRDRAIE